MSLPAHFDILRTTISRFSTAFALDPATRKILEANLEKLKQLRDGLDDSDNPPTDVLEELKKKILEKGVLTSKDCRRICLYASDLVENSDGKITYGRIAEIARENWNDRFLRPLLRFHLYHWLELKRTSERNAMRELDDLFLEKLEAYSGHQNSPKNWQENRRFLSFPNGDFQLAKELRSKKMRLAEFQKILDVPEEWFHASYFQRVIRSYYKADSILGIQEVLESDLEKHGDADTRLLVLSDFIRRQNLSEEERIAIQSLSLRMIGHPEKTGIWILNPNEPSENKEFVKEARAQLKQWLIKDYVSEVFDKLFQDSERKNFWMEKCHLISSVKVVGDFVGKDKLSQVEAIKDSLDVYYKETVSGYNPSSNAYAFIMQIRNHLFIEYSIKGNALYIFYINSKAFKESFLASLDGVLYNTGKLKSPKLRLLNGNNTPFSCKLIHVSSWQMDLNEWMGKYVL